MRKYLLFYGHDYYPSGGINDFEGSFDSIKEAKSNKIDSDDYWSHIVLLDDMSKVCSFYCGQWVNEGEEPVFEKDDPFNPDYSNMTLYPAITPFKRVP